MNALSMTRITTMHRRYPSRGTVVRLVLALAVLLGVVGTASARAQESPAVDWQQTSLTASVSKLYTPSSGALLARTRTGLTRSDDAGETWRDVPLPAPSAWATAHAWLPGVVVDPTNHDTIYVGDQGLSKTVDGGATWRLILPVDSTYSRFSTLAISPANPNILYLVLTTLDVEHIRFMRSTDGGETWTEPDSALDPPDRHTVMPCYWGTSLLVPHPSDELRLIRAVDCSARGRWVAVRESFDGGTTWRELRAPRNTDPHWLVGWQADAPDRLILGSNEGYRLGSYTIEQSDDSGTTWTTRHTYHGGEVGPNPAAGITGLAMDPTRSDRLLLALIIEGRGQPVAPLRLSLDAGQTWLESAPEGLGRANDVAFGIDGKLLFAATGSGVWRAPAP